MSEASLGSGSAGRMRRAADTMPTSEPKKQDLERLEALKRSLRDDPRSLAFVTLAEEHNRLGQHAEAADVAQRGLLSHPDSVAGRLALAVAEAERENIREALEQIKRALIIDQENPKALALMGRILLKRGLAKRAVQFLSHAVKLEPKSAEYLELLRQARRMAKGEPAQDPIPVFDASSVPSSEDNPWSDDGSGHDPTSDGLAESEHTVFDPDALKQLQGKHKLRKPDGLQQKLQSLPEVGDFHEEEEPTAYLQTGGGLGRVREDSKPDPREEPTAYAAPNPLAPDAAPRKAKVGGSAADFSQMMRQPDVAQATADAEAQARRAPLDAVPEAPRGASQRAKAPASGGIRTPMEAPSVRQAREAISGAQPVPSPPPAPPAPSADLITTPPTPASPPAAPPAEPAPAPEKPPSAPAPAAKAEPAPPPAAAPAPAKAEPAPAAKAEPPPAEPAAHKKVGHVATRMVDDALWALYGQTSPEPAPEESSAPAPAAEAEPGPKKKPAQRAKLRTPDAPAKGKAEAAAPAEAQGPMVVRTSKRFGTWTGAAAILVGAVAAGFVGHWVALASAGPGPEVAGEELKGVASDLERGGLASLLAAEDQIGVLARSNPALAPLLDGALAEIYARRWWRFGHDPKLKTDAQAKLQALGRRRATVETLAAMTIVSTSAADRAQIRKALAQTRIEYPDSPKSYLVEGWTHQRDADSDQAIVAFYKAHQLHPQHRGALLAIARWHAQAGAFGTAFGFFDKLQDKYPDDVEVAIERYVLGRLSGADPAEAEAVSALAGLVREEIPQVAKDEAGRAALAFALPLFAQGQLRAGLRELEKAESAFDASPRFKRALGGAFLAVGEFDRAEVQFKRALELGGDRAAARRGLARARLGQAGRFRLDLSEEGARMQKALEKRKPEPGAAELPFGTLRFVLGRFELIAFEARSDIFPEDTYAALSGKLKGEPLQKALDAASFVALGQVRGRNGDCDAAVPLFKKANALAPTAAARFAVARCLVDREDWAGAEAALDKALQDEPEHVPGWLMLGQARQARGDDIGAIKALERFERQDPVVPSALYLLGSAKLRRGDWEGALKDLSAVTDHLPDHAAAQLATGEILHKLGRTDEALEAHRGALAAKPELGRKARRRSQALSPVQLLYLGRLVASRNPRRGVAMMKESLRFEDSPLETHFYLGKALIGSRRTRKEGKRALEKFMRNGPEGKLRDQAQRLLRGR